jgi:oxalate decarboxylase/phosphoglucose isomerase-like protein (cupin superfamily)
VKLLDIDRPAFEARFGKAAFLLQHRLAGDALFSLERLVALSRTLPADKVEYNAGDLPVSVDPASTPRNGLSAEETIRRIRECRSWLVLKNVERDPAYRALLERCLAEVNALRGTPAPSMSEKHGFIFVSSPGAVTPYHMDPEENFLLQIRGRKTMHVFDPADRAVLSEQEIERFFSGAHRNLAFRDEYQPRAQAFALRPGLAVHVPMTAPHWVQNGPEVSVSFSITFQTAASMRRQHAHRMNARLRRLGVEPRPIGESPLRDGLKQLCYRVVRAAAV